MNGASDQFFAAAAFPGNEDGGVGLGDPLGQLEQLAHGRARDNRRHSQVGLDLWTHLNLSRLSTGLDRIAIVLRSQYLRVIH